MTAPNSGAPRIAVIGTCQVAGIGATLRHLIPNSDVSTWHVGVHPAETNEQTHERLRDFDLVISQFENIGESGILNIANLRATLPNVVYLPVVAFRGFQPDCIYLPTEGGIIKGGLADLHSGIIAAAFCLGLPRSRVPRLFNSFVYANLGYFDVYPVAQQNICQTFDAAGYDLRPHMESWLRAGGAFMYTINHPQIRVLSTLATLAAKQARLVHPDAPVPSDVYDDLASSLQWPIYPDIARRIGIEGILTFVQPTFGLPSGHDRSLLLTEFIDVSYKCYESISLDQLIAGVPQDIYSRLAEMVS